MSQPDHSERPRLRGFGVDVVGIAFEKVSILRAYGKKQIFIEPAKNAITLKGISIPDDLPAGFCQESKCRLVSEIPGFFTHNSWLEELCLHRAQVVLGNCSLTRAAANLHIISKKHRGQDEADIVLVRGSQVCVIEAKARLDGAGAGADLMKRMQKTRRFFGVLAKTVFVHPAWGAVPPEALVELAGDKATLVGANVDLIDTAIRSALSITVDPRQNASQKSIIRPNEESSGPMAESLAAFRDSLRARDGLRS